MQKTSRRKLIFSRMPSTSRIYISQIQLIKEQNLPKKCTYKYAPWGDRYKLDCNTKKFKNQTGKLKLNFTAVAFFGEPDYRFSIVIFKIWEWQGLGWEWH